MSVVAALIVLYGYQLRHGTYLGRAWVIAAVAGMVTAAWLGAAVWTSNRRRRPAAFRLSAVFLVLVALSASAIGFPFPLGPYGKVQAFFNVAKAAMLGFEVVTCTALLALMAYALLRHQSAARRREPPAGLATGHDADPDQDGQSVRGFACRPPLSRYRDPGRRYVMAIGQQAWSTIRGCMTGREVPIAWTRTYPCGSLVIRRRRLACTGPMGQHSFTARNLQFAMGIFGAEHTQRRAGSGAWEPGVLASLGRGQYVGACARPHRL